MGCQTTTIAWNKVSAFDSSQWLAGFAEMAPERSILFRLRCVASGHPAHNSRARRILSLPPEPVNTIGLRAEAVHRSTSSSRLSGACLHSR
jgi:hypothetical protein